MGLVGVFEKVRVFEGLGGEGQEDWLELFGAVWGAGQEEELGSFGLFSRWNLGIIIQFLLIYEVYIFFFMFLNLDFILGFIFRFRVWKSKWKISLKNFRGI